MIFLPKSIDFCAAIKYTDTCKCLSHPSLMERFLFHWVHQRSFLYSIQILPDSFTMEAGGLLHIKKKEE